MDVIDPDAILDGVTLNYDVSSSELALVLARMFPGTVHGKDYWCGHKVADSSSERVSTAIILQWVSTEHSQPSYDAIADACVQYADVIAEFRTREDRSLSYRPISARQLWLMARQAGISKADVLATLDPASTDTDVERERKEVLYIELTEPPLEGFLRDSPAAEDFRVFMGLPTEQFDDMWRMAQEI